MVGSDDRRTITGDVILALDVDPIPRPQDRGQRSLDHPIEHVFPFPRSGEGYAGTGLGEPCGLRAPLDAEVPVAPVVRTA